MNTTIALRYPALFPPRFRDQVRSVWRGLRAPPDSGERKTARYALLHVLSLVVSVMLNGLVALLLIGVVAGRGVPAKPELGTVVMLRNAADNEIAPLTPPPDESAADSPAAAAFASADAIVPSIPIGNVLTVPAAEAPRQPLLAAPRTAPRVQARAFTVAGLQQRTGDGRAAGLAQNHGNRETEDAVLRALRWLKENQDADGGWRMGCPAAAGTGLALLTFLAHGETPRSPEFGATVRNGLQRLQALQQSDGNFRDTGSHHAYGHAIATYAVCEAVALTRIVELQEPAERAVAVIIRGQQPGGGWGYDYAPTRADTSVMGWQIQALKAATFAQLEVEGLQNALHRAGPGMRAQASPSGGFGYTGPGNGPLTAAGTLCLQMLGLGRVQEVRMGLTILSEWTVDWESPQPGRPLYHWYYCTQARFHQGGEAWESWNARLWRELVRHQTVATGRDGGTVGHWESPQGEDEGPGPIYSTTLCTLMLEVYYRTLSTYTVVEPVVGSAIADPDDVGIEVRRPNS